MHIRTEAGMDIKSSILMDAAEAALSPKLAHDRGTELFRVAPNTSEISQANQRAHWKRLWNERAKRLIWC